MRAGIEPRQCAWHFDLQNNISDSPLSLPFPGVSSLTWTVGENRAVLFFARELLDWNAW
jgi:hypothetical protein